MLNVNETRVVLLLLILGLFSSCSMLKCCQQYNNSSECMYLQDPLKTVTFNINEAKSVCIPSMHFIPGSTVSIGLDIQPRIWLEKQVSIVFHKPSMVFRVNETSFDDCQPSYIRRIDSFYLAETQVKYKDYALYRKNHQPLSSVRLDNYTWRPIFPDDIGEYPAGMVTITDALGYADWISKETGIEFRLPTEEEWEMVAKGGLDLQFAFGTDVKQADFLFEYIPCGKRRPNAYGIYDLYSSTLDWCFNVNGTKEKYILKGSIPWFDHEATDIATLSTSYRWKEFQIDDVFIGLRLAADCDKNGNIKRSPD